MSKNYSIYKITCKDKNIKKCFIGCTTNLKRMEYKHKYKESLYGHIQPIYLFIRKNGGWNNWNMIVIEELLCDNLKQCNEIISNYLILDLNLNLTIMKKNKKVNS